MFSLQFFPLQTDGPPHPRPWIQRQSSEPSPFSHAPLSSQILPPSRPGILVEATQPFSIQNPVGMIRWLLGTRIGEDKVREVVVSWDRRRLFVELSHPEGS